MAGHVSGHSSNSIGGGVRGIVVCRWPLNLSTLNLSALVNVGLLSDSECDVFSRISTSGNIQVQIGLKVVYKLQRGFTFQINN